MQVYLFSGSFLFVYSALKARFLSDECDAIEPVCRVSLSEIKGVCTFAKLELIKTHKSK